MCGLNGFTWRDPQKIQEMNKLTAHRGPDATDFYVSDAMTLGHNRLAIIDLSPEAGQPMWDNERRFVIVYNGEIYNFKELRAELESKYSFRSQSDTEVILYAYKEYGPDCVKRLNGIFALAIWDTQTQELFMARDHSGIKPFYYWHNGTQFIFSSEIKAILAHQAVPRRVNKAAANFYFQLLYVPEPLTMFEGIYKLPAATCGIFKNGQLALEGYWQVPDYANYASEREAYVDIQTVFKDSIKGQLISDRPVGVFLSGGLDSTAVLGAVRELKGKGVKTFSVGFSDHHEPEKFNADFNLARATARLYNTDHHELLIGAKDIADNLKSIVWHLDEPNSNPTAGAIFLLSKLAKQHVAVVLGGDGGDELFAGYPRHYFSRLISAYQKMPQALRRIFSDHIAPRRWQENVAKLNLPPNEARLVAFLCQKESDLSAVVNSNLLNRNAVLAHFHNRYFAPTKEAFSLFPPCEGGAQGGLGEFEKLFREVDRQSWLVDESLVRTDKMSMAFGLEARVPILDYRLIEVAARIPTAWQISLWQRPGNFQGKRLWRQAVRQYVPDHVLNQTKRGWFTPMAKWLRGDLKPVVAEIILGNRLPEEYFNRAGVAKMWQDHVELRRYNLNLIWAIVMWQLWYERFIVGSE